MPKRDYRTLDRLEEEYLRKHPKQVEKYLAVQFEEYAKDRNTGALLASLRVIGRVVGLSHIAEETGMSRKGVQKALSEDGNPRFDGINAIMHAMGYQLMPMRMEQQ